MTNPITVLVVDNEPGFAALAEEMLEREREAIDAVPATSADEALELLEQRAIDCIVSDYEMPAMSGLELLERVREDDPDLPFILFTGRGSEEVASEAIAAGVTQYLQKGTGDEQYTLLANQITNAVSQYRAETELRESERRYERTLTTLHETTRDLMRAESKAEIYRSAVDTAGDILDVPLAVAYAFDPTAGRLERAAATDSQTLAEPVATMQRGESRVWDAFSEGDSAYYEDLECDEVAEAGQDPAPTPRTDRGRSELIVPLGTHGVLIARTEDADGFDETMTELLHILAANTEAALDRAEREQLLRDRDRTLTRKNEELTRLNHINEIVREINHGIAQAATREEIESIVCERLADTDRYRFAWLATTDDEPPAPTAWAGIDAAYVDRIRDDAPYSPEVELVRDALETNDVRVVENVLEDDTWNRRRKEALTYGFQTVLAVPLVDDERQRGVLVVHVGGADAIGGGERDVLSELGETIGHAIRSVERTRALLTDSRLELELRCTDPRMLLNRVTERVDGPVALEGVIDRGDEIVTFVSAPTTAAIPELVADKASVTSVSEVSDGDDESLFEVTVEPTPFFEILRGYDVALRTAIGEDGATTLTLEVPQRVEPRSLVESIAETYPETELEARRETTTLSARQLDTHIEERLTEKQLEALQAAHYSGFFEWPRETTGEDLAATLSVSAPTYHYHLRAAQRKLVSLAFDGDSS
ncbi:bacterio-opsin activator domain-containing protein [Halopiger xanaduensis]|uniref:Response regulator receiver modulated GAF sensor protein n=1 Tax=Halopiger xanaduensis (strain DSM 18323 / JCM 14033 / SH-6) TaxID=797210 RepID=F8D7I9_HALXS|nr:bacterio-opsin activator domain-containing protein [Halopiger xanaduensis]AEH36284.1 response regulator receiver modulated GAF sensor protein [Halopiger xanaduensis SH-6]